jgi:hypothetical protein
VTPGDSQSGAALLDLPAASNALSAASQMRLDEDLAMIRGSQLEIIVVMPADQIPAARVYIAGKRGCRQIEFEARAQPAGATWQ